MSAWVMAGQVGLAPGWHQFQVAALIISPDFLFSERGGTAIILDVLAQAQLVTLALPYPFIPPSWY